MSAVINYLLNNLQLLAIIGGFIGTYLSIRRQTKVFQTYVALEFFRRYSNITSAMPDRLRFARYVNDASPISEEESRLITRSAIAYWNLCSEEHALWKQGRIPSEIWKLWAMGIRDSFEAEIWRSTWAKVSREYAPNKPFSRFMAKLVREAELAAVKKAATQAAAATSHSEQAGQQASLA